MTQQEQTLFSTALDLVAKAYEAAAEGTWANFLNSIADATSCEGTVLWLHDAADSSARMQDSEASFLCNVRIAPEFLKSYAEHYTRTNILLREVDAEPEGAVMVSSRIIRDEEFHKTEYYNDWLRPQGIGYLLGGPVLKRSGVVSMFSLSRLEARGPFQPEDFQLLSLVMPHLRRACLLHKRLASLNTRQSGALAALELLPSAAWLFDARGQLLFTNRAGRELNDQRDGLWLDCQGRPVAADPLEYRRLRRAVEGAICAGRDLIGEFDASLLIRRVRSPVPLRVMIYPLRCDGLVSGAAAAMFITDPTRTQVEHEAPRLMYGLTRTEARLAVHLARGHSIADYCMSNEVTTNTARTHLKHVFAKTGTRRQAQLASLLSGSIER